MEIGSKMIYTGKLYLEYQYKLCTVLECTKNGLCTVEFDDTGDEKLVMNFTLVNPEISQEGGSNNGD